MPERFGQPVFQWLPEYAIGVHQIDQEHQRLFAHADRMHQALLAGKGREILEALLAELIQYAGCHFAHEEQLMKRIGYPGYGEHRKEHEDLRARVAAMQERAAAGELTMTIEVMQFLMEWLKRHTIASDRRISSYMTTRGL
jgi:hemerythrin